MLLALVHVSHAFLARLHLVSWSQLQFHSWKARAHLGWFLWALARWQHSAQPLYRPDLRTTSATFFGALLILPLLSLFSLLFWALWKLWALWALSASSSFPVSPGLRSQSQPPREVLFPWLFPSALKITKIFADTSKSFPSINPTWFPVRHPLLVDILRKNVWIKPALRNFGSTMDLKQPLPIWITADPLPNISKNTCWSPHLCWISALKMWENHPKQQSMVGSNQPFVLCYIYPICSPQE